MHLPEAVEYHDPGGLGFGAGDGWEGVGIGAGAPAWIGNGIAVEGMGASMPPGIWNGVLPEPAAWICADMTALASAGPGLTPVLVIRGP